MAFAIMIIYIAYLHIKIVLYKQVIGDMQVSEVDASIQCLDAIARHSESKIARYCETRLVSLWDSFEHEPLQSHPGHLVWQYRIEKQLKEVGKFKGLYPRALTGRIDDLGAVPPQAGNEYYHAWDNPMINWWP